MESSLEKEASSITMSGMSLGSLETNLGGSDVIVSSAIMMSGRGSEALAAGLTSSGVLFFFSSRVCFLSSCNLFLISSCFMMAILSVFLVCCLGISGVSDVWGFL